MPRAITWGSAKASAMVLIGPAGTPAFSNCAVNSARVNLMVNSLSRGISVPRLTMRAGLVAYRSSLGISESPRIAIIFTNWLSLPQAISTWPSEQGKVWYGTTAGCALPMRFGGVPETR